MENTSEIKRFYEFKIDTKEGIMYFGSSFIGYLDENGVYCTTNYYSFKSLFAGQKKHSQFLTETIRGNFTGSELDAKIREYGVFTSFDKIGEFFREARGEFPIN